MQNWWHDVACGARLRVTLLQVDLGGHSQWLAQEYADDYLGPYLERSKFARMLREQLRPLLLSQQNKTGMSGLGCISNVRGFEEILHHLGLLLSLVQMRAHREF